MIAHSCLTHESDTLKTLKRVDIRLIYVFFALNVFKKLHKKLPPNVIMSIQHIKKKGPIAARSDRVRTTMPARIQSKVPHTCWRCAERRGPYLYYSVVCVRSAVLSHVGVVVVQTVQSYNACMCMYFQFQDETVVLPNSVALSSDIYARRSSCRS